MLFNSFPFLFAFLPVVLVGFHLVGRLGRVAAIGWLSAASLAFYGYWNRAFLLLLLGSIVFNFLCAQAIAGAGQGGRPQRGFLCAGIVGNLSLLGYYKYLFPFLNAAGSLTTPEHHFGSVVLPLGISFFTFTQIGYLIDLQQGEASALGLLDHLFFVAFFPHLIAGPILHHREFMPQVTKSRVFRLDWEDVAVGSTWFVMGLFKKVAIADQIAPGADLLYASPDGQPLFKVWYGVLCYAVQIYFDFSGYSDMAIGLARMFSLRFPLNFNSPYKAASIIEFWQRWHITLTNYLRLYVFNPIALAVNFRRMAQGKAVGRPGLGTADGFTSMIGIPSLITMLVAGIWHGAGRQFLAFGLLHGIFICINHAWRTFLPKSRAGLGSGHAAAAASVFVTFIAILSAQVFFRADSVEDAFAVFRGAAGANGLGLAPYVGPDFSHWVVLGLIFVVIWYFPNTQEILGQYSGEKNTRAAGNFWQWQPTWSWTVAVAAAFFISFVLIRSAARFLYFQF